MQETRSYGSVGVPAGNRWHYPEGLALRGGTGSARASKK